MPALYVLFAAAMTLAAGKTAAEELVTALSSNWVSIESNFTGAEIVLFGTIERDANTIARRKGYDIVIVTRGPDQEVVTRRKERVAGVWANADARRYLNAPSYLAVLSNRQLTDIAPEAARTQYQLGLDKLILLQPGQYSPEDANSQFKAALLRLMQQKELYVKSETGVVLLSPSLFLARIPLPAHVPIGTYTATVHLFADGAMLAQSSVQIVIRKGGFEAFVSQSAVQYPLLYGLAAVLLAMVSGWLANVAFRKD